MADPIEWLTLFLRIKLRIVQLLDYESRCNLRLCSKKDRDLVDSAQFVAENIRIAEFPSDLAPEKTIIRVDVDSFTIWFIGRNEVTKVERAWNGELDGRLEMKQESRFEVARRYLERYSNQHDGRFAAKSVKLHGISLLPSENWKVRCDRLVILDLPNLAWLRQTAPKLKHLEVSNRETNAIGTLPHIVSTSETLKVYQSSDVNDGTLALIEATNLRIGSDEITPEGVRDALERFLKRGKLDDTLDFELPLPPGFDPMHLIPASVTVRRDSQPPVYSPEAYNGKIIGGFENVHGIQEARLFTCYPYDSRLFVTCRIHKKMTYPLMMYPFTKHW